MNTQREDATMSDITNTANDSLAADVHRVVAS